MPSPGLPAGPLAGRKVVVTAGGTREAIDAVRFIGNRSSGKMGRAVADEAYLRGRRGRPDRHDAGWRSGRDGLPARARRDAPPRWPKRWLRDGRRGRAGDGGGGRRLPAGRSRRGQDRASRRRASHPRARADARHPRRDATHGPRARRLRRRSRTAPRPRPRQEGRQRRRPPGLQRHPRGRHRHRLRRERDHDPDAVQRGARAAHEQGRLRARHPRPARDGRSERAGVRGGRRGCLAGDRTVLHFGSRSRRYPA